MIGGVLIVSVVTVAGCDAVCVIRGTVRDEDGSAIAGATITASITDDELPMAVTANDMGEFYLEYTVAPVARSREITLVVEQVQYVSQSHRIPTCEKKYGLVITLRKAKGKGGRSH
jgi:hypothetical protein